MPELVAREAEHHQAPGPEALLQLVHLGVVPDRCASERRHILNEQHLAPQGAQAHGLPARQRARGEGVHGARGRSRLRGRRQLSSAHVAEQGSTGETNIREPGVRFLIGGNRVTWRTFPDRPAPPLRPRLIRHEASLGTLISKAGGVRPGRMRTPPRLGGAAGTPSPTQAGPALLQPPVTPPGTRAKVSKRSLGYAILLYLQYVSFCCQVQGEF